MVRVSKGLLQKAGAELGPLGKTLSDILVCPLSKQPLRYCEETNSLISDAVGVSFPIQFLSEKAGFCLDSRIIFSVSDMSLRLIKNGIPCLVPQDGKILEVENASNPADAVNSSARNEESQQKTS